jgi:hypothetical protein
MSYRAKGVPAHFISVGPASAAKGGVFAFAPTDIWNDKFCQLLCVPLKRLYLIVLDVVDIRTCIFVVE